MANEPPGWPITRSANFLPPPKIILTARSTSTPTSLPWEGRPSPSMPPSVTPSEGSSTSEGAGGIESPETTTEGSSTSEGQGGIESTVTATESAGGIGLTDTPNERSSRSEGPGGLQTIATSDEISTRSEDSEVTGVATQQENYGLSTFGDDGFSSSERHSETQNSTTPITLRYFTIKLSR